MDKPKYRKALVLPFRIDFHQKGDRLGTKNSFMVRNIPKPRDQFLQSKTEFTNVWEVSTRRYDKKKGGYYKTLRSGTKEEMIQYAKKRTGYRGGI